jgi:broad specificity phosphatase PhoE
VTVWLVRHGETEWSRTQRHTGRTDIELTEAGREQARAAGRALAGRDFALVLSSPLRRARETAALAGLPEPEEDDDLVEWDYGIYEGRSTAEIREEQPGWDIWKDGCPESGEPLSAIGERADRVIARALEAEGDVALVAHGHFLRILGARWIGLEPIGGGLLALGTAALCELSFERERRVIERWNETGHLAPAR